MSTGLFFLPDDLNSSLHRRRHGSSRTLTIRTPPSLSRRNWSSRQAFLSCRSLHTCPYPLNNDLQTILSPDPSSLYFRFPTGYPTPGSGFGGPLSNPCTVSNQSSGLVTLSKSNGTLQTSPQSSSSKFALAGTPYTQYKTVAESADRLSLKRKLGRDVRRNVSKFMGCSPL